MSRNESDRFVDLLIYKNLYVLIKKTNVFSGVNHKNFICRRFLNSYTSENMLKIHKAKCGNNDITTIRTSPEPHLHWKKHFHKNLLYFGIHAVFEADNEKDNFSVGNKTTNIYKQNPVVNGYEILSELEDVLKKDYHKFLLGYDNIDWFVYEVTKLESQKAFHFIETKNDIIMTEEDEKKYGKNIICRFCEKNNECDKVKDHCHLTSKYRGPAHSFCKNNVTQKQSKFIPVIFLNFKNYDCHMFFKKIS